MSLNDMTLGEFIEYAEVYDYSQDRFVFEKTMMELNLMKLHLESYEYLLENNNISLNQLDQLMVESGIHDKSSATEEMFIEKASDIFQMVKNAFIRIGKALAAGMRKIGRFLSKENNQVNQIQQHNQQQADLINKLGALGGLAGLAGAAGALNGVNAAGGGAGGLDAEKLQALGVPVDAANNLKGQLERVVQHIDANLGGGGPKITPVTVADHENAIRVILDWANNSSGNPVDDKKLDIYSTIMQPEYQVEGLALINNIDKILDEISDIVDTKAEGTSEMAYNSAKNMMKMGPDSLDRINKIVEEIEVNTKKNARFTLNEEMINKKIEAADKIQKTFESLANFTDVGEVIMGDPIKNFVNRIGKDTPDQDRRSSEAMNNAVMRAKQDPDMKFKPQVANVNGARKLIAHEIKKSDFLKNYPAYMNQLNKLAVKLQSAAAEMSKALVAHMTFRSKIIEAHTSISNSVEQITAAIQSNPEILDALKSSVASAKQKTQ